MVLEACATILKLLIVSIVGAVKALLPTGLLPRKSVSGQVVLITGAGSGLGRLMAFEFGKLGARVVLWDLNEKANLETKEKLVESGGEAYAYTVNLAKRDEIYSTAERVKREVGNVDILINNAGIVTGKKFLDCPDNLMELSMNVNCTSHFFTTKAFLPYMLEANHGHIVSIASMAGVAPTAGLVDYCASKHGAVGFSKSVASELVLLKKDGVHVTTVCPFFIGTGMFDGVETKSPFLLPIMTPEYVVEQIMEAVLTNKEIVYLPRSCYLAAFLGSFLPSEAVHILEEYLGTTNSMDHFVGHEKVRGREHESG